MNGAAFRLPSPDAGYNLFAFPAVALEAFDFFVLRCLEGIARQIGSKDYAE
jgi:hypothetical protein